VKERRVLTAGWSSSDMEILPQHSVMPYERKNSQPKVVSAVETSAGASGEPPHERSSSDERSRAEAVCSVRSIEIIELATLLTVTRSVAMASRTAAAEKAGAPATKACAPPASVIEYMAYASTRWNIGAKWPHTSSWWWRCSLTQPTAWLTTMVCVRQTPFGRPLVPDV
jgi:hypothetical protein